MSGKPKRARTERREKARALAKADAAIGKALDRVAASSPGGSPEAPIVVQSPAAIEDRARREPCHRCQAAVDLTGEAVEFRAGRQLRRFTLRCRKCKATRDLWFAIDAVRS